VEQQSVWPNKVIRECLFPLRWLLVSSVACLIKPVQKM
jgi:hypothetical protein